MFHLSLLYLAILKTYMNITCHVFNVEYTVLIHLNFKRIVNTCIDLLIGNTNEIFFRKLLVLYTFFWGAEGLAGKGILAFELGIEPTMVPLKASDLEQFLKTFNRFRFTLLTLVWRVCGCLLRSVEFSIF